MVPNIVVIKQNRYIRVFRNADALSMHTAKSLSELGIRESFIFGRMEKKGVFIRTANGKYFMNEDALAEFRRRRMMIMLILIAFVIILWVIITLQ
jgi:hypothetical protein